MAWGVECFAKDVPGVYASVSDALCFIQWDTKCKHGLDYDTFFDIPGCNDYTKKAMDDLNEYAKKAPGNPYLEEVKKRLQNLENSCRLDCSNFNCDLEFSGASIRKDRN